MPGPLWWSQGGGAFSYERGTPVMNEAHGVLRNPSVGTDPILNSRMQTLVIYELGFYQNNYTRGLILLIKIVLCGKFPGTKFINYKCFDTRLGGGVPARRGAHRSPQKALRGGIPDPYLEPLTRTWNQILGIYRQQLMKSSKNDF